MDRTDYKRPNTIPTSTGRGAQFYRKKE